MNTFIPKGFPEGHFYSPIPSDHETKNYFEAQKIDLSYLSGINLNIEEQYKELMEYFKFYNEIKFPHQKSAKKRYFFENDWFSYSDSIFLYCFLRKYKPKNIIEVGGGFSTAVILDTIDEVSNWNPHLTLIEPNPERLESLLLESDFKNLNIVKKSVQVLSPDIFRGLSKGDLLFIDSSHVYKCGSDLQYIFNQVIPNLNLGCFVHFHDIFFPFEYPQSWIDEGRYWNENYFLRAFLTNNDSWRICFFNDFVHKRFKDFISQKMNLCINNTGGSFYMSREK